VLLTALIIKVYKILENKDTVHINYIDLREIEICRRIIPKIYQGENNYPLFHKVSIPVESECVFMPARLAVRGSPASE
jgi:hypothetical protein